MSAFRESLPTSVRDLGPLLSERVEYADRELRLADDVIDALTESNLLRLWNPRRYGGLEVDVTTQLVVTAELAKYCATAGWVTALYSACAFFTGLYSGEAQEEVFGREADARVCGVLAPSATVREDNGGIRVDGSLFWQAGE